MYTHYQQCCIVQKRKRVCAKVFHRIRKEENIGILRGDQYSDEMWIRLCNSQKEYDRIVDLNSDELLDMASLQWNLKRLIVIVDFTKWNQAKEGNVHDFVVVLASGWIGPIPVCENFFVEIA